MLQGIYNAAASLSALERMQETISQNLAAGNAAGYRKLMISMEGTNSGKLNQLGTTMPKVSTGTSFAAGDLHQTGKPTDLAVSGPGFFQIKGPDGKPLYTRDGEFQIGASGTLVNKRGWEVMGEGGPITLNPNDGPASISPSGVVSQGDKTVGKVPLYDFTKPEALQRREGGYFSPGEGATAVPVTQPTVLQGFTESANASPMSEMVNMVTVSRAYEASQKLITSQDDLMHQAIQTLGNP